MRSSDGSCDIELQGTLVEPELRHSSHAEDCRDVWHTRCARQRAFQKRARSIATVSIVSAFIASRYFVRASPSLTRLAEPQVNAGRPSLIKSMSAINRACLPLLFGKGNLRDIETRAGRLACYGSPSDG